LQAVEQLSAWNGEDAIGQLQVSEGVTKAPRFAKSHGQLDFRLPAEYLVRLIRALQPWPGTFAELQLAGGKQLRILVRAARASTYDSGKPAGEAWACDTRQLGCDWSAPWQNVLAIATGAGTLLVARVQPASKREMDAQEFLRGHSLFHGASFTLPTPPLSELQ
jgi:methionyl-tRNA formyltransferase